MLQYPDNHSWNAIAEKLARSDALLTSINVPSIGVYQLIEAGVLLMNIITKFGVNLYEN